MILPILESLESTSSRIEKEAILRGLSLEEESLFKRVCEMTYSPTIDYYIRQYDNTGLHAGLVDLDDALNDLEMITSRKVTGNAARDLLEQLSHNLSTNDAEVLWKIVQRDLRCGISASTINKIWPNLIYVHPYMRCNSFNEKNLSALKFPCISQTKEDGLYVDIIVDEDGDVTYRSRSGSFLSFSNPELEGALYQFAGNVFMGEGLVLDETGELSAREVGNGYLNSNDIDTNRICFVLWDMVDLESYEKKLCKTPYSTRYSNLINTIEFINHDRLRLVGSKQVSNAEELIVHFKENLEKGKEGTVAKNLNGQWKPGTSKDQIKMKIEFTCELEVTEVVEGTGKNVGKLGALRCKSACGKLTVSAGGGYSDKQRVEYYDQSMIGKIIEVKSNDIMSKDGQHSLFLPRHVKVRFDKTEADTLERVIEQRESFIKLVDKAS